MDALLDARPTFYELVMQERLAGLLSSALRFTLETVAVHYPRFVGIRYYVDEIAAVLVGMLDLYYLRTVGGTHAEQFYGLQRTMGKGFRHRLVAVLTSHLPKVLLTRLLGGSRQIIESGYSVLKVAFMLHYLLFKGAYYSPEYYLLGHKLERGNGQSGLRVGVFIAILLLKILEFWFQGHSEAQLNSIVGPVPAPFSHSDIPRNLCGICRNAPVNPTALDVSGYVFCHTCIKAHLETFGSCPLSGEAADLSNLRQVRS
jgi:peroxin-12